MSDSWITGVTDDDPFGPHNLPYGSAVLAGASSPRVVVRIGEVVLDLAAACAALRPELVALVDGPGLDRLLAAGPHEWHELRQAVQAWLTDDADRSTLEPLLHPLRGARLELPFTVADYVDFYASENHATNIGRLFRPNAEPLTPNWKHLPIGYHGRSGTIVVSGTEIARPSGQRREPDASVAFGPSTRLDIEAEIGFVVGGASTIGQPVPLDQAGERVFGVCIVNDWSARDIQAWETVPLGPFLGKSFATSVSPWIVPLAALHNARVTPPPRDVGLLPYLDDATLEPWGFDIALSIELNGERIASSPFASMYWTAAQMLAHLSVNGASVRPGDLFASGTVSGPERGQEGSLIELTRAGAEPVRLSDGTERAFLIDGDEVTIRAAVPATSARPELGLGAVSGRIVAAG